MQNSMNRHGAGTVFRTCNKDIHMESITTVCYLSLVGLSPLALTRNVNIHPYDYLVVSKGLTWEF